MLPSANGVAKVMFSLMCVHQSVFLSAGRGVPAIEGPVLTPPPSQSPVPVFTGPRPSPSSVHHPGPLPCTAPVLPPQPLKLVHYKAWTVGKWAVGIQLYCLLVQICFKLGKYFDLMKSMDLCGQSFAASSLFFSCMIHRC